MADDSLSALYTTNRKSADREELDTWLAAEAAKPVVAEAVPAPGAEGPEKKPKPGVLEAGVTAVKDTFLEGASNFIGGIVANQQTTGEAFSATGQSLLGVLQVLSALPAGAGAAVQAALGKYAPGMEEAVAIPGGKAGEITAAGIINSVLGAPGLLLDPKMKAAIAKDPIPAAEALNEPITYGQLANIITQFVAVPAAAKVGKAVRGRGGAPGEPIRSVQGEIVTEGAPPRALPQGREPLALPAAQPEPIVTPPPGVSSSLDTRLRAAQMQGPAAYAAEAAAQLKAAFDQMPARAGLRDRLREKYRTQMEEAPKAGVPEAAGEAAAPEGALKSAVEQAMEGQPERPGDLATALDTALQRSEAIVAEEIATLQKAPTPSVDVVAGDRAPAMADVGKLEARQRPTVEPSEIIQRVEQEMPDATPAQKEARINELTGVEAEAPVVVEAPAAMDWAAGKIDPGMLARMGLGAALGGSQGDTPEERIRNAFLGIGLGAVLSKRLATRLGEAYKTSGLADETGAMNVGAFTKKPSVQASEQPFQPNYQRIRATPEVLATMKNIHRAMKDDILARRGAARTNDARVQEGLAMIRDGKMTPDRVLNLGDKEMLTDAEMTGARILSVRATEYATAIKQQILKGEAVPEGSLRESIAIAGAMGRNVRVAQTRIAQAQQASSIRVSGERVGYRPEDVAHLADEILPGMTDKQIAVLMGKMTPEQAGQAATFWSLFPRMALEGMYFSYLSGKAVFRNFVGNATMMGLAPVERGIAQFMPRWGSPKPGVLPGEATQMARALGDSLVDQVRMLRHLDEMDAKAGQLGLNISSTAIKSDRRQPALSAANLQDLGLENQTLLTLGEWTGNTLRFPGAVLDKTDVGSKLINGNMAHRVEAFRQASFEGLRVDKFEARVNELLTDVTKLNQSARQRIVDFADEQTLTKDFQSKFMQSIARGPDSEWLNLAYRGFVMPFFRVVARMTEQTMIRQPGLNFLAKQFWDDWHAGGAQRQVAQARLVSGAAITGAWMYMESQGMITGNRPKDPKLAGLWDDAGYRERSWWDPVSGKWRSYDGLGPLTSLIAGAADTSLTIRKLPEDEGVQVAFAYLLSQINSLDSRTFTQSISNLIDVVKNPKGDSQIEQAMTFLRKQIAGWLKPGVIRELETLGDPEVRRVIRDGNIEDSAGREFQAMLDEIRAGWPGFSSEKDEHGNFLVPPARNRITGEPTIVESWPFNPFPGKSPKALPFKKPANAPPDAKGDVFEELLRLNGAGIDDLPDWIGGAQPGANVGMSKESLQAGQRLTPAEKDRWVLLMTQVVKPLGGTYQEALKAEMESPQYWAQSDGQRGTDGGKADRLQLIERAYRKAAEQQLRGESPALDRAIMQRRGERAINKVPTAQQPGAREMFEGMLNR